MGTQDNTLGGNMSYAARMSLFVLLALSVTGGAGIGFYHYWLDQSKSAEAELLKDVMVEVENEDVKLISDDEVNTVVPVVAGGQSNDGEEGVTSINSQTEKKQQVRTTYKNEETESDPLVPNSDSPPTTSVSYGDDSTRIIVEEGVELEGLDVKAELHNKVIKDDEVIHMKP